MPPAVASEKVGSELGPPQTPAGGLRPPAEELLLRSVRAYYLWRE
jgi:hypothetical protein